MHWVVGVVLAGMWIWWVVQKYLRHQVYFTFSESGERPGRARWEEGRQWRGQQHRLGIMVGIGGLVLLCAATVMWPTVAAAGARVFPTATPTASNTPTVTATPTATATLTGTAGTPTVDPMLVLLTGTPRVSGGMPTGVPLYSSLATAPSSSATPRPTATPRTISVRVEVTKVVTVEVTRVVTIVQSPTPAGPTQTPWVIVVIVTPTHTPSPTPTVTETHTPTSTPTETPTP